MDKNTEIILDLFIIRLLGDDLNDRTCQDSWNMKRSYKVATNDYNFKLVKSLLISK